MLIKTYVLQRVLCIRVGGNTGTAFLVEHDKKQYIVTARHVVADAGRGLSEVLVRHDRQWKRAPVSVVALGEANKDVAVLAHVGGPLAVVGEQPGLEGRVAFGQPVCFLGFPFGWDGGGEEVANGYPLPFVKAGIVSAVLPPSGPDNATTLYIDAHGNAGFSGGPLVYEPVEGQAPFAIAGVIVDMLLDSSTKTHAGFVRAVGIKEVVDMIEGNPIGAPL